MSSISDWQSTYIAAVIKEASLEEISAMYHITVQQNRTKALFNKGTDMLVISPKFFDSLSQKSKLLKSNTCTVTSTNGTD